MTGPVIKRKWNCGGRDTATSFRNRALKIARTIADLHRATELVPTHVSEAIHYRSLDRRGLG